jgi:hypothetical protein
LSLSQIFVIIPTNYHPKRPFLLELREKKHAASADLKIFGYVLVKYQNCGKDFPKRAQVFFFKEPKNFGDNLF